MNIVVSGMSESASMDVASAMGLPAAGVLWKDPADIDAIHSQLADGSSELVWLYQSPARVAVSVALAGGDVRAALRDWFASNQKALELARKGQGKVRVVESRAPGPLGTNETKEAGPAYVWLADRLLEHVPLRAGDLYRALQANCESIASQPATALTPEAVEECVYELLELSGRARSGAPLSHDADAGAGERDSLLLQLHDTLEELERYYLQGVQRLEELEKERSARNAADDEVRALRMQLAYMQDELRQSAGAPVLPGHFVQQRPLWRRAAGFAKRNVLRRFRPGATSSTEEAARLAEIAELRTSRWFDHDWYLSQYQDVRDAGMDPAEHFHHFGWIERRDPSAGFSTRFYLASNPDVADTRMNPLLHFIRHGIREGRLPRKP